MIFWKRIKNAVERRYHLWRFIREAKRCGVRLALGKGVYLNNCHIWVHGNTTNHKLVIKDHCSVKYVNFGFPGSNNSIRLGERTKINSWDGSRTLLHAGDNSNIIIGEDGLLANGIIISTTDYHKIYDSNGVRINCDKDVIIGSHVWIGQRAYLTKGVYVANNSIVGACSVVTKSFSLENSIMAGNPAKIIKENINWES